MKIITVTPEIIHAISSEGHQDTVNQLLLQLWAWKCWIQSGSFGGKPRQL